MDKNSTSSSSENLQDDDNEVVKEDSLLEDDVFSKQDDDTIGAPSETKDTTDAIDEKYIQEEIEREFAQEEVKELTTETKATIGPAGPYKPFVPEVQEEEVTNQDATDDDYLDEIGIDDAEKGPNVSASTETIDVQNQATEKEVVDEPATVDEAVDELLSVEPRQAQEAAATEAELHAKEKKKRFARIKKVFKGWWHNKKIRYATFIVLFLLLSAVVLVPATRYATLNLVGIRVSTSVQIIDSETRLPLENIPVSLDGSIIRSNEEGLVEFTGVKLGEATLVIDKLGYAKVDRQLTLGLGSNPLGPQLVTATGEQFRFIATDWLSKSILNEVEASSGEDIAKANNEGSILLTVGDLSDGAEVRISAPGYRDETFLLTDLNEGVNDVVLVPGKKHVFVSNRSGEYDLYKIDVDGKNEEVVLEATGKEREIPFVLPHQEENIAAYISSRDAERNSGGFILDGLFIVDIETNEVKRVYRSEQLQVIGWLDSKLIYVAVVEGVSAANPQRSKVFSYDVDTNEQYELAASNYFNDVKIVDDKVYYSVSSAAVPQSQAKLFSIDAEGISKELVVDTQVWSILREDYKTLLLSATDREWYRQTIGGEVTKLENQPVTRKTKIYVPAPNEQQALWVDIRDGKGVLLNYVVQTDQEESIITMPGLSEPVYWLNDSYVVYRVSTSDETADYVLHLESGETRKIADVVGNQSRFFY
jgi:hypothetical protein